MEQAKEEIAGPAGTRDPRAREVVPVGRRAQQDPSAAKPDASLKRKAAALYAENQRHNAAQPAAQALDIRPAARPRLQAPDPAAGNVQEPAAALPTLEQLQAAPRYGLNARELILQAATRVGSAGTSTAAARGSGARAQPALRPAASARPAAARPPPSFDIQRLLEAVPHPQRPQVEYNPRCSVPRLQRQAASDRLLGGYLSLLLTLTKRAAPTDPDATVHKMIKLDELLRKAASTAATAHELALFRSIIGKDAYTHACKAPHWQPSLPSLAQFGGEPMQAIMRRHGLTPADLQPRPAAQAAPPQPPAGEPHAASAPADAAADLFGDESGSDAESGDPGVSPAGVGQGGVDHGSAHEPHADHILAHTRQDDNTDASPELSPDMAHDMGTDSGATTGQENGASQANVRVTKLAPAVSTQVPSTTQHTTPHAGRHTEMSAQSPDGADQGSGGVVSPEGGGDVGCGSKGVGGDGAYDQWQNAEPSGTAAPKVASPVVGTGVRKVTLPAVRGSAGRQASQQQQQQRQQGGQEPGELPTAAASQPDTAEPGELPAAAASQSAASTAAPGNAAVAAQVGEFARGILEPYIRANLLDRQQYKDIIRKTVHKVMSHHKDATTAAFLLKEHEAVRRLIVKLVETVTAAATG